MKKKSSCRTNSKPDWDYILSITRNSENSINVFSGEFLHYRFSCEKICTLDLT